MEARFTKGKWIVKKMINSYYIIPEDSTPNNYTIIAYHNETLIDRNANSKEIKYIKEILHPNEKANAILCSSAPEMLEQLISIVDGSAFDKETGYISEKRFEEIKKLVEYSSMGHLAECEDWFDFFKSTK
jgi:hypothetical protein